MPYPEPWHNRPFLVDFIRWVLIFRYKMLGNHMGKLIKIFITSFSQSEERGIKWEYLLESERKYLALWKSVISLKAFMRMYVLTMEQ